MTEKLFGFAAAQKYASDSVVGAVSIDSEIPPSAPVSAANSVQLPAIYRHT